MRERVSNVGWLLPDDFTVVFQAKRDGWFFGPWWAKAWVRHEPTGAHLATMSARHPWTLTQRGRHLATLDAEEKSIAVFRAMLAADARFPKEMSE